MSFVLHACWSPSPSQGAFVSAPVSFILNNSIKSKSIITGPQAGASGKMGMVKAPEGGISQLCWVGGASRGSPPPAL